MIDVENLSLSDLMLLTARCQKEIDRREQQRITEVKKEIIELAESVGMSPAQLLSAGETRPKKGKVSVAPKYRNPENPEQTWTGRGKRPGWVNELLEQGKDLETMRIAA